MSRGIYRTSSAGSGINRQRSISRPTSALRQTEPSEVQALQEQVAILQHELLMSRATEKKLNENLNCIILLIKGAWLGDNASNVHLSSIVGVAPPKIISETKDGKTTVTSKPKSRAVNHWAMLNRGLLNLEHMKMEKEIEADQLSFLKQRHEYLSDELLLDKTQVRCKLTPSPAVQRSVSSHLGMYSRPGQISQPQDRHCTSPIEGLKVCAESLHQQERSETDQSNVPGTALVKYIKEDEDAARMEQFTWADIVVKPGHWKKTNGTNNKVINRQNTNSPAGVESDKAYSSVITYGTTNRYVPNNLFSFNPVLDGGDIICREKRPLTKQMKRADIIRARPRSAVVKQDRSLKYEAVRPMSAQRAFRSTNNNNKKNPPAQKFNKSTDAKDPKQPVIGQPVDKNQASHVARELQHRKEQLLIDDPELASLLRVDVQQPECIKQFDDQLQQMRNKENDFTKRAIELQRKLGIRSGIILDM